MRSFVARRGWPGVATLLGVLFVFSALAGCGGPGKSKVSGKVLYNGSPLPGGRLLFRPADQRQSAVAAVIDADGNYSAELPRGEVQVTVDNKELKPRPKIDFAPPKGFKPPADSGAAKQAGDTTGTASGGTYDKLPGTYVQIPDKYGDADQSGLGFAVTGSTQERNIELSGPPKK